LHTQTCMSIFKRRLEHCLGVGHLAYTLADSIYKMQRHELDVTRSDVKCAEIAGANLIFHFSRIMLACSGASMRRQTECLDSRRWACDVNAHGAVTYYHIKTIFDAVIWICCICKKYSGVSLLQGLCMTWGMDHTAMSLIAS